MKSAIRNPRSAIVARRDDNMLWLLVSVVLFAGLLVATGVYVFCRYVVRDVITVHDEVLNRRMKIQTPAGSMEATQGEGSVPRIGLPIYPGAWPTGRSGASLALHIPLQKNMQMVTAEFSTPDPFDMVVNYYRRRLSPPVKESRGTNEVRFSMISNGKQKVVVVRRNGLRTEIAMANITEASGQ